MWREMQAGHPRGRGRRIEEKMEYAGGATVREARHGVENGQRRVAALVLADAAVRRAMEAVCRTLEVLPLAMGEAELEGSSAAPLKMESLEMVIADEPAARRLRRRMNELQGTGEWMMPALVAVGAASLGPDDGQAGDGQAGDFDAVLTAPLNAADQMADWAARLSVVLYSHRALAQRYQSAMEELNLNRSIFRSVTNGISVANAELPDTPLMYVNPSFELMTGYSLEEVQGKNCRFLQGEERDQPGLTLVREALRQGRQTVAVIRNYRKDGSGFWNELTLSPIRNREGKVTHFVGIQMDVTERVEMESALRESEKLAAVGRLASSISHEINNPLEAVMNLLYLAEQTAVRQPENGESLGYLRQADEELQRVKLITAQSLRFYKQSTGPETVLAEDLVSSVLDMYRGRLLNYNVQVLLRKRSTQHIVGLGSELRQVMNNLIGNALDAMKARGGRLMVRTREATWQRGGERRGVLITVADTGTGMPVKVLEKIYTAFYTTKGASGTGLWLWISAEIVARHRGHLKVRSCNVEGKSYTVFELFLPFQGAAGTGRGRLSVVSCQLSVVSCQLSGVGMGYALMRRRGWALMLAGMMTAGPWAAGQDAAGGKVFEAASVRPSRADADSHTNVPLDAGNVYSEISADDARSAAGGYLVATHQALWRYISFAYKLTGTQELALRFNVFAGVPKSGAPFWVTGSFTGQPEYFDISARAGADASIDDLRMMMRALLAERFHLALHLVVADAPAFGLVQVEPGVLGAALRVHAASDGCTGPVAGLPPVCGVIAHVASTAAGLHYGGRAVALGLLASSVPTMTGLAAMPRPVVDQTGLKGLYDFTLTWEHDSAGGDAAVGDNAANFRDALRRQLGLELKNTRAPLSFVVVDRVERPVEN